MNTLPELVAQAAIIEQKVIEAGGELTPEIEALLESVGQDLQAKTDGYCFFMERLDAQAEYWKTKADAFAKVSKSCKSLKERLNDRIKEAMKQMGLDEIQGTDMRFKLTASAPKLVVDDALLPKDYLMAVTEYVPDKERIKEDLKNKCEIPGAQFEDVFALRKYPNRKTK